MPSQIKTFLLLLFTIILFMPSSSSSSSSNNLHALEDGRKSTLPSVQEGGSVQVVKTRKLMTVVTAVQDYDYAEPNPKHDPRKGKPGSGGPNTP
ncbi:PREDICTED: uncharacterized protein LOC104604742 [Nelumbo nucifera]|uniref:Uncharacterized protein LOC104604742 n=1 Tax=Nelumbo nucifera TaxID=4432 RepID=A0A1U8AX02_NELNU|nr:PREDICTED: uncharacterized protein LOC104604742 [Nelumbo nucifera]